MADNDEHPGEMNVSWTLTHREKNYFVAAARRKGMSLEDWIRFTCEEAVRDDPDPIRLAVETLPLLLDVAA